jgi:hypothetical protein
MDNVLFVLVFDSLDKVMLGVFAVVDVGGTAEDADPEIRIYTYVGNIPKYEQYQHVSINRKSV